MAKKLTLKRRSLESKVEEASKAYYSGSGSTISDAEFDQAVVKLKKENPNAPILSKVGSPELAEDKVVHKIPMGSLENCMNVDEVKKWHSANRQEEIILSHKVDGLSMSLEYEKGLLISAVTRGDGKVGAQVLFSVFNIPGISSLLPNTFTGFVRGEVYLKKSDFAIINTHKEARGSEPFKNPRNAAAGIVRNEDCDYASFLSFFAFDILPSIGVFDSLLGKFNTLKNMGFDVPSPQLKNLSNLEGEYLSQQDNRSKLDYEIDGLVVSYNLVRIQEKLGGTDKYPKWARALKFPANEKTTKLTGVTFSMGHTGAIIPTGNLEPVEIDGTTVSNALLCNIEEIERLGLKIGHEVVVCKRGDIIPKIEGISEMGEHSEELQDILFPNACPYCDHPTKKVGVHVCCTNALCPERRVRKIISFASKSKMDIMHLGEKAVRILYLNGVDSIKKLLGVDTKTLVHLLGENGHKISKSIQNVCQKSAYEYIGSLGIEMCGKRRTKEIIDGLAITYVDAFLALSVKDLESLPGFKVGLATKIVDGIAQAMEEICAIPTSSAFYNKEDNAVTSLGEVVFTGKVDISINGERATRKVLTTIAEQNGYTTASSVSKSTKMLVQADPSSSSSKTVKAGKLGVEVISDVEFLNRVGVSV